MTISWLADKIEQWPTAKLVPYARNSRTHSDAQVAQIAASIAEFGFTNPILAGSDGVIVASWFTPLMPVRMAMKSVALVEVNSRLTISTPNALAALSNSSARP